MSITLEQRYLGAMLGLACGDALGTSVEFSERGSFVPLTTIRGGGPFSLKAGYWTDDTSMALCLAESMLNKQGFDARDQMGRYLNWWKWGYLSSTGHCFDIGMTVRDALQRYQQDGQPFAGRIDPDTAGNGSLMRLAPVVLYYFGDSAQIQAFAAQSSRTTHGAPEAVECCLLFARLLELALQGIDVRSLLLQGLAHSDLLREVELHEPAVVAMLHCDWRQRPIETIRGSGYCVASLEAVLWCFCHSASLQDALLMAANLGEDADTTAAIVGQLAGACYGVAEIPASWLQVLHMSDEISSIARALHDVARVRMTRQVDVN